MKKILLLFVVLTALYSCKKSSDADVTPDTVVTPPTTASLLLGQWKFLRDSTIYFDKGTPTTKITTYTNAAIMFENNGTGADSNSSFYYLLTGNQLAFNYPASQTITGGVTTTIPEQFFTATVVNISATKMTLNFDMTIKDTNGLTTGASIYSIYAK